MRWAVNYERRGQCRGGGSPVPTLPRVASAVVVVLFALYAATRQVTHSLNSLTGLQVFSQVIYRALQIDTDANWWSHVSRRSAGLT